MEPFQLLTVPIENLHDRINECLHFIPYDQRPTSCTDTTALVLGFITQETFQQFATTQRNTPYIADTIEIGRALSRSVNSNVTLTPITLEEAYAKISPNTGTMVCSSRYQGIGHTMILSRNLNNEPLLIDPSMGTTYVGEEQIRDYVQQQNFSTHAVPVVTTDRPLTLTPWGGGKPTLIMVNIKTINLDKYVVLGNVASKTFANLISRKKVPLILYPIDIKSTLTTMKSNTATLIYGNGHTMVLLKQTKLILLDPKTDMEIVGYSNIMNYLKYFSSISALSKPLKPNSNSKSYKTKTINKTMSRTNYL